MSLSVNYTKSLLAFLALILLTAALSAELTRGSGTETDPYLVGSAAELNEVRNHLNSFFLQTADIDLNVAPYNQGTGWVAIGNSSSHFGGCYNGNGYYIRNLVSNFSTTPGLFGTSTNAVFRNINLDGFMISSHIIGVGSLVRYAYYTQFEDCSAGGNVSAENTVGILAGYVTNSSLHNCSAVGYLHSDCNPSGGLIGRIENTTLLGCHANVSVNGSFFSGGLIGQSTTGTISQCWSSSQVNASLSSSGGLVGYLILSECNDCFTTGNVSGQSSLGGFCGIGENSTIRNCFSTGSVTGNNNISGFIASVYGNTTVTNCYWNTETSGLTTSTAGTGATNALMLYPYAGQCYSGWDFETVWQHDVTGTVNNGFPYLRLMQVTANQDSHIPPVQAVQLTNSPNPFFAFTAISFSLPKSSSVRLSVYNQKGQLVRTLSESVFTRGEHRLDWDGTGSNGKAAAKGIYFLRLQGEGFVQTRKLLLLR